MSGSFSLGLGWSDYEPKDLNLFLNKMESKLESSGLSGKRHFSGAVQEKVELALHLRRIKFGVEVQHWRDEYSKKGIGFDLSDPVNAQMSCDELRQLGESNSRGCAQSRVTMQFVPVLFRVGGYWENSFLNAWISLGSGPVLGRSDLKFRANYFDSGNSREEVGYKIDPNFSFQYELSGSFDWKAHKNWRVGFVAGYRILNFAQFKLGEKEGASNLFDLLFNYPVKGDLFYFESFGSSLPSEILIGSEEDKAQTSTLDAAEGNFSGWFTGLKVLYYWGK